MEKNKVAVIGLKYDTNIGDAIIGESLIYLLKQENFSCDIISLDLKARKGVFCPKTKSKSLKIVNLLKRLKKKSGLLKYLYFQIAKKRKVRKYFQDNLQRVKCIVFAGGGIIESEHYECHHYIDIITKIADKNNIEIIYNAVGFNGHYKNNFSYRLLSSCLKNKCVKYISVRENPEEMVKYIEKKVDFVCDPACWSAEAYNIKKNDQSKIIGIGLIRPEIFREFGIKVSDDDIDRLYYKILDKLQVNGYEYELFTNGVKDDYEFGINLMNNHKDLNIRQILTPKAPIDLLKIIAQYRAVLCARMHASICSYSLNIPSVNLCWNEKLSHFYSNIDYSDRCFNQDDFSFNREAA